MKSRDAQALSKLTGARPLRVILSIALLATTSSLTAGPQHIQALAENGFLTTPEISPPVVTLTAGSPFLALVPDSRQELCQIELEYYAGENPNVTQVRIVDSNGQELLTCGA
jgi:hypothetical protein